MIQISCTSSGFGSAQQYHGSFRNGIVAGPLVTGDYSTLLHHAEVSRTRAYANSPLGSAFAALGVTDEILVPMAPLGGTDRRLLLFRADGAPDFSEREKAMLAHDRARLPPPEPVTSGPATIPFLNEPWYCCAEPNPEDVQLI